MLTVSLVQRGQILSSFSPVFVRSALLTPFISLAAVRFLWHHSKASKQKVLQILILPLSIRHTVTLDFYGLLPSSQTFLFHKPLRRMSVHAKQNLSNIFLHSFYTIYRNKQDEIQNATKTLQGTAGHLPVRPRTVWTQVLPKDICTGKNCALLSSMIESQDMGTNHLKLPKYDKEKKYGPTYLLRFVITLLSIW